MRYLFLAATLGLFLVSTHSGEAAQTSPVAGHKALIDKYCVGCHNQRAKIGGLALDGKDLNRIPQDAELWEKAVRKLRGGLMPPPGSNQPEKAAVDSLVTFLETTLDQAAVANPNPGLVALHRLNRAEYSNAVEDLLGVRVDAAALLPTDDVSDGFDNIANVLKVSPSFLDQYIGAARVVTDQAVGTPPPSAPVTVTLRGGVNDDGKGGVPLGLRPSLLVQHLFPADGDYEFRMAAGGRGAAPDPGSNIVTLDGVKVPLTGRVAVKAGLHKVAVSAPARSFAESENLLQSFIPGNAGINYGATAGAAGGRGGAGAGLQVAGPYNPNGPILESASRRKIFVCKPPVESEELACATRILSNIARKAFRRPVTAQDLKAPLAFFKDGRSTGNFDSGIQTGLIAIVASPKFLYRAEPAPQNLAPGAIRRITDLELASRLSFFLWSSAPDDALLTLAEQGKLKDPAVLDQQVRRMLAAPRSNSLVSNFAFQWLRVREVDKIEPDAILFPGFDQNLRTAFRREMEMFVQSIISEDRSALDLLRANYTFANERLAAHYGIPDVRGEQFRKVTLTDSRRWGLLGKGALLMVTSYPNRTAPVLRGAWILENIAGTPPAAPPADVEGFKENKEGEKALTVREIMQLHRAKPSCNACHGVMDPLGFSLENFDAIGEWRDKDRWAGSVIDASGQLVDGSPVSGPDDLRKALLKHPQQFVQTLTEKLLTYALGRRVEYYDMPVVRKIVRDAAREDYRFSSLVMGIAKSAPFQMSKVAEAAKPASPVAAVRPK